MEPLAVTALVVSKHTGRGIKSAKRLIEKGVLIDCEVITDDDKVFTVTVNTQTAQPIGHFFEGVDPVKAELINFRVVGQACVELGNGITKKNKH